MAHATIAAPTAYAPPVPSPLNPRSDASLHMLDPLLPISGHPKPPPKNRPGSSNRKRAVRNISPTQRLMRQKAALAWHTAQALSPHPKRTSSLLPLDHKPTTYNTNQHQQSHQRPFTSFSQLEDQQPSYQSHHQQEYGDMFSHPNFSIFGSSGSPGIATVHDPPHVNIEERDIDETDDFGLPTARIDAEKEALLYSSDGDSANGRRRSVGELEAQTTGTEGRIWWWSPRLAMVDRGDPLLRIMVGGRMLLWVALGTLLLVCGILPFIRYYHVEEEVLGAFA